MAAAAAFSIGFSSLSRAADADAVTSPSSSCLRLRSNRSKETGPRSRAVVRATGSSSPIPPPKKKQKAATGAPTATTASPLKSAEDLASRLGLDLAIAGLERLFSSPSHSPAVDDASPMPPTPEDSTPPGRPLRVAYQGPRGSYSQEAAAAAFSSLPRPLISAFPCPLMESAFSALEDGAADRAVVPAENSLDGPVHRNLDLLLRHPLVEIVGEVVLPVNHCLLALPGVPLPSIPCVAGHPQALAHCRSNLAALGLATEEAPNSAEAARALAEGRLPPDTAVLGSRAAAEEFGLAALRENLQDADTASGGRGNYTRFLQLALRRPDAPRRRNVAGGKATVAFSLEKGPSELYRAIWAFESRGLAVTRVDHRPNRRSPVRIVDRAGDRVGYFDYVFVVDVESAGAAAVELGPSVARLREICGFVRPLGVYASRGAR